MFEELEFAIEITYGVVGVISSRDVVADVDCLELLELEICVERICDVNLCFVTIAFVEPRGKTDKGVDTSDAKRLPFERPVDVADMRVVDLSDLVACDDASVEVVVDRNRCVLT